VGEKQYGRGRGGRVDGHAERRRDNPSAAVPQPNSSAKRTHSLTPTVKGTRITRSRRISRRDEDAAVVHNPFVKFAVIGVIRVLYVARRGNLAQENNLCRVSDAEEPSAAVPQPNRSTSNGLLFRGRSGEHELHEDPELHELLEKDFTGADACTPSSVSRS